MRYTTISVALLASALTGLASAQTTPASSYFNVTEAKAGCQRLAKLQVHRKLVRSDDRLEKNVSRTVADLERVASRASDWGKFVKRPEAAARLVADIKALKAIATTPITTDAVLIDAIASADRCSANAEEVLKEIQGPGAGGKAITLAGRALYNSQRLVRDWMLLRSEGRFAGITLKTAEKERDDMSFLLKQLEELPATAATRASLELAKNQWTLLRPLLTPGKGTPEKDEQIGRISEQLYEALDDSFEQIQKALIAML